MEFSDNRPIYLQLADQIMDDVEQGWMNNGDRIPSVREFAARSGVNANTVMRSYSWLQNEKIIYNQRGIGYFYTDDARERVLEMRREIFNEKEMGYFMSRLATFGITPGEFAKEYENYLKRMKDEDK